MKKVNACTKEKILLIAEELIAIEGANNFSLRDITKKAKISLGTLYYYYKSKEEIISDIALKHLNKLNDEYFEWLNRHQDDLKPERFFEIIFYKGVKLYDRARIHLFLVNQCIGGNQKLSRRFKSLYLSWQQNLKKGIKQIYPNNQNAEALSALIMIILDGLIVREALKIESEEDKENIKKMLEDFSK